MSQMHKRQSDINQAFSNTIAQMRHCAKRNRTRNVWYSEGRGRHQHVNNADAFITTKPSRIQQPAAVIYNNRCSNLYDGYY